MAILMRNMWANMKNHIETDVLNGLAHGILRYLIFSQDMINGSSCRRFVREVMVQFG